MSLSIIIYLLGTILKIEGILMVLPLLVSVLHREPQGMWFLIVGACAFLVGFIITLKKPTSSVFYLKDGCVVTALSWVLMSLVGALPLWLSGVIPRYIDALFEIVSGFTTTGASILEDVEALPLGCLFWRSFTHWIGGMGVLVFMLAVIPLAGGSNMNLMKAESPGPSVGKLVPKVRATARILYLIYIVMTLIQLVFMLIGGMPFLEALMITFGTAGTGGFGVRNSSIGGYSPYIQWVVGIFMLLFGINFNLYYFLMLKRFREALKMEEVKAYLGYIFAAVLLVFVSLLGRGANAAETFRHAFFQVSSMATSTGYSTVDFDMWPGFTKTVIIIVMFVGACAGSTAGGLKVSRVLIAMKNTRKEIHNYLHPKSVKKIKMDGKPIDSEMLVSVGIYLFVFALVFTVSVLLVSLDGMDLVSNFTAVLTTLNNMGPGLNMVGPARNFHALSDLSKYVLMFDMLAGRLELFPMLLIFHPGLWMEAADKVRKWVRSKRS